MEVLKRCIRKMKYYKGRTALMVLFYTAVFVVFFVVATAYFAVRQEIRQAEANVGCSISIYKTVKRLYYDDTESIDQLEDPEIEALASQKLVKDYDPIHTGSVVYELEKNREGSVSEYDYAYPAVMCRDSSLMPHFTSMGYRLLEGEGISEKNEDQNVIVISERVATEENLRLGDKMTLEGTPYTTGFATTGKKLEMEVVGIYSINSDIALETSGELKMISPEYILFLPLQAVVDNGMLGTSVDMLWLFFDNMDDTAAYVDWFEENYGDSVFHPVAKWESSHGDFITQYKYQWNEDGYKKIVKPLLEMKRLCEALLVVVGIAAALIIWNVGAMALRTSRREFAVLQSCGEKMEKVLWQDLLEQIIPMACAAVLAAILASAFSGQVTQALTRGYTASQGQITEMSKQKYDIDILDRLDPVSRMNTNIGITDTRLQELERPDISAGRWAGALAAGLAAILAALYLQGLLYFRKKKIHEMMQEE